jgi:hypothetical protein
MATAKFNTYDGRDWYRISGVDYGTGREFNGELYGLTRDGAIIDADGSPLTEGDGETIAVRNAIRQSAEERAPRPAPAGHQPRPGGTRNATRGNEMNGNSKWIGPAEDLEVGQAGFLIEFSNPYKRSETWVLRDTPAHTNDSHEPRLEGWCGSWNDTSTHAHGMAKVARVARNGRAQVVAITGAELTAALEELGYPELDPATA